VTTAGVEGMLSNSSSSSMLSPLNRNIISYLLLSVGWWTEFNWLTARSSSILVSKQQGICMIFDDSFANPP
jgi:hypothetical protein